MNLIHKILIKYNQFYHAFKILKNVRQNDKSSLDEL